jgi:hypothetical protein
MDLKSALRRERLELYVRLRGGYLFPLAGAILAIGMAMHWPIIGWTYARTALYSTLAIVRTLAAFAIWILFPDHRTTWLPASVAVVYLLTVLAIAVDTRRVSAELAS